MSAIATGNISMRSKRRVTLFHNESAGDADHARDELTALIEAAGYAVAWFDLKGCDIARALADPGDLIAVAGGDGSVRKVALAAPPDGPPIAILPFGTANNIANSLGIAASVQELVAGWNEPRLTKFHPIELEAPWGRQRLIEGIGFGVLAQMIEEASGSEKPSPLGARERMAEMLRHCEPEKLDIRIDDARLSGPIVLLEVTTIPLVGPNLHLAPGADPADQLIDLCCVTIEDRSAVADWLEAPASRTPVPVPARSANHIAISGRFGRIRVDDTVHNKDSGEIATITLASATEPLRFVVPR